MYLSYLRLTVINSIHVGSKHNLRLGELGKDSSHYACSYYAMSQVEIYEYSEEDADQIINYARDTLEVYTKEGQKMDVGSVNDLLNMRAGIFMKIESTGAFSRVRGSAGSFGNQRLASAIINSTVYASSDRSVGSEIARNELSDIKLQIAPIREMYITDDPVADINLGTDVPVITEGENGWIYPADPEQYDWSVEEYLTKTCKKCNMEPHHWEDKQILIARTSPIKESIDG